jgi:anaphase-promoting complex subunit 8
MSLRANVLYHLHGKQPSRLCLMLPTKVLDFPAAEQQFEKILKIDPCRIDDIDVYSNILYVTENHLTLSRLAHDFLALDKDRPEVCCLVGTILFSRLT